MFCGSASAKRASLSYDPTYGGCDTKFALAQQARVGVLSESQLSQLASGCTAAKIEYLLAASSTGKKSLPGLKLEGKGWLHALASLTERLAVATPDADWKRQFLETYRESALRAWRLTAGGNLPEDIRQIATELSLSPSSLECDAVCESLNLEAGEPSGVADKVAYYLAAPRAFTIVRLIELGPDALSAALDFVQTGSNVSPLELDAIKLDVAAALKSAGDVRYRQIGGLKSPQARAALQGLDAMRPFMASRLDIWATRAVYLINQWGLKK